MTHSDLSSSLRTLEVTNPRVLVCHPDGVLRDALTEVLTSHSMQVSVAGDIPSVLQLLRASIIHVAVLGVRGGSFNGFDVLRYIRGNAEIEMMPVLILTEGADYERIVSLELGADDCMLAPFSNREIRLRVQSLLRRSFCQQSLPSAAHLVIDTPEFYFNPVTLDIRIEGKPVLLSGNEFRILMLLVSRLGFVVDKQTLIQLLSTSSESPQDYRTINTQMRRLRKKLGPMGIYLQNIRDIGYRLSWKES